MSGIIQRYSPRIPNAYQEVEYIGSRSSREQYINTHVIPTNANRTKVWFKMRLKDATVGEYQSLGSNTNLNMYAPLELLKFRSNGVDIIDLDTEWHTITMSKSTSGKITIFDGVEYSTTATTEYGYEFYLFALNAGNNRYGGYYDLQEFKVVENDILVRDMIPCYRKSDNMVGMYDVVNDVFYTNDGNGVFLSGPNVNEWNDIPYTRLETATDAVTTLPVTTYNDGTSATVAIKGNMSQSGTPTPSSPITPSETGEKTAQIFNLSDASQMTSFNCTPTIYQGALTQVNRGIYARTEWSINKFQIGKQYTISVQFNNVDASSIIVRILDSDGSTVIANSDTTTNTSGNLKVTFTARNVKQYIRFYSNSLNTGNTSTVVFSDIMLNEGSTALPYEPYGYKLPIVSGGVTTNAYLGEVQSTRKIKKVVFTGEENWQLQSTNQYGIANYRLYISNDDACVSGQALSYCTHYEQQQSSIANTKTIGFLWAGDIPSTTFYIRELAADYADAIAFKAYLAAQYAAGTPVTVWYVLATETTGIVNEPIRKIGDYADSVSVANIPTTAGGQTFDVDTTLKPSEVSLTYHGWHEHEAEKRENGSWVNE